MKNIISLFLVLSLLSCSNRNSYKIVVAESATPLENLAAAEIRKYIYQRTGELFEISHDDSDAKQKFILKLDTILSDEEFKLKTEGDILTISGGTPRAILYGAYELAEQFGVRFYLHGDVIPDKKIKFALPVLDIQKKPLFTKRGILPFHDFPEGPDWWNENDYLAVIAQLPKLKMNFIGFHTYPEQEVPYYLQNLGQGYDAEPLVWIGKQDEINVDGTVKSGYPNLHFTTHNSNWGYHKKPTSEFSSGASQLFETDGFGTDYMKNISSWPHTEIENIRIFNESGRLFNKAFSFARTVGVTTCVGTETPLIIPKMVKDRHQITNKTDEDIKTFYKGMFARITKTYPIDYYWLWTPEGWTWEGAEEGHVAAVERDLRLAHEALQESGSPFQLATCGWVLGPPNDRAQFDRLLPKNIPFSCINRAQGYAPVEKSFEKLEGRSKWSIPWLEDDPAMISAQLWVGRMLKDALDSYRYGCDGLLGIHWRTRIIGPNVSALAKSAWEAEHWQGLVADSVRDLPADDFYADWTFANFGIKDQRLVDIFVKIDSKGTMTKEGRPGDAPLLSSTWNGGPGALLANNELTDLKNRLSRYDFIDELEQFETMVQGKGNLERFNYWLNNFRFNKAQIVTACAARELNDLMKIISDLPDPIQQKELARKEALPKRIELASAWKKMTEILLSVITTNGELGTLANLEMHNMNCMGFLNKHDAKLEELLQEKLSENAFLPLNYSGQNRVIVTTNQPVLTIGEDFYLRTRVLSSEKQLSGKLFWRLLGKGPYQSIPLVNMARNVFEVAIPASKIQGDFEYYIEVNAGSKSVKYPATAGDINATVTLF